MKVEPSEKNNTWDITVSLKNTSKEVEVLPPKNIVETLSSIKFVPNYKLGSHLRRLKNGSVKRDAVLWSPPMLDNVLPGETRVYNLIWKNDKSYQREGVFFVTIPESSVEVIKSLPITLDK